MVRHDILIGSISQQTGANRAAGTRRGEAVRCAVRQLFADVTGRPLDDSLPASYYMTSRYYEHSNKLEQHR